MTSNPTPDRKAIPTREEVARIINPLDMHPGASGSALNLARKDVALKQADQILALFSPLQAIATRAEEERDEAVKVVRYYATTANSAHANAFLAKLKPHVSTLSGGGFSSSRDHEPKAGAALEGGE